MLVALLFGALDGLQAAGLDLTALDVLPLFDVGLAWLLPTLAMTVVCLRLPGKTARMAGVAEAGPMMP